LDEIGQVARKDLAQRIAQKRMIAADPKHAPSAEEVKIPAASAIDQILPLAGAKTDVEAKRLQHANHHFVQMLGVQRVAVPFTLGQHGADVEGPAALVGCRLMNLHIPHIRLLARASNQTQLIAWVSDGAGSALQSGFTWPDRVSPHPGWTAKTNVFSIR
jgi:hypothetical protein